MYQTQRHHCWGTYDHGFTHDHALYELCVHSMYGEYVLCYYTHIFISKNVREYQNQSLYE